MIPLITIEHRINLLRDVNISSFDLDERIEYHVALIETLKDRLKTLLFYFNYKTALVVEAEIKEEVKKLLVCLELASIDSEDLDTFLKEKAKEKNRFREMVEAGNKLPKMSLNDIKRNIRTILFGVPFELSFDGEGFVIEKRLPELNIEKELAGLEEFCKINEFKLLNNETRTKSKIDECSVLYVKVVE